MTASDAEHIENQGPIVLYDGLCGLCNASVDFIIDHDPAGRFHFAALESDIGRQLLAQHQLRIIAGSTMVLIDGNRAYLQSTAAMRICQLLGGPLTWLGEFLAMIPAPLRDAVYDWVARNRHRWFGRRKACRMPTPAIAARFL